MNMKAAGRTAQSQSPIEVIPTGAALAAEMRGVDLNRIDDRIFAAIHRAWIDHLVLLFRNQKLDDDALIAFSRRFGDLDWAPVQETGRRFVEGLPEIYIVSNVIENGEPIGSLGRGRSGLAHRHVLYFRSAQGEHALRAGSSALGRRHRLRQYVFRLRGDAGRSEKSASTVSA